MARRFGRNQRRRAREEIAQLTGEGNLARERAFILKNDLNQWRDKCGRAEDEVERAREVLQPYTLALPPETLEVDGEARSSIEMPIWPEPSLELLGADTPMEQMIRIASLEVLLSSVRREEFTRAVHVNVRFAGQHVAYAIERDALRLLPKNRFVRDIATALAEQLERDLRKVGIRG